MDRIPAAAVKDVLGRPGAVRRGALRISSADAQSLGLMPAAKRKHRPDGIDPQAVLTQALRARLGDDAVLSEVRNLIPGRRYRADIVIPDRRLVIEFDGFQYHRSKAAFQKDRERQNLFVAHGWRVLRFFNKQVRDDLDGVVGQILSLVTP
jgi:very-short-patch-repair endonuclease